MKNKLNLTNENGITLVVLVLIITVLLILAGIYIIVPSGENSIIRNAQKSKVETEQSEIEEKVKIAVMGAYDKSGNFDMTQLKNDLIDLGLTYIEEENDLLIQLPNGNKIIVPKVVKNS